MRFNVLKVLDRMKLRREKTTTTRAFGEPAQWVGNVDRGGTIAAINRTSCMCGWNDDNAREQWGGAPKLEPFRIPLQLIRCPSRSSKQLRSSNAEIFYTLAASEESSIKFNGGAMKRIPSKADIKPTAGKDVYLTSRYEQRPADKYNFPEATSWRYGWFH